MVGKLRIVRAEVFAAALTPPLEDGEPQRGGAAAQPSERIDECDNVLFAIGRRRKEPGEDTSGDLTKRQDEVGLKRGLGNDSP